MIEEYRKAAKERQELNIPPLPLTAEQTNDLVDLLKAPPKGEEEFLMHLFSERVPAGVDDAAYVKTAFLRAIVKGEVSSPLINKKEAVFYLGTMLGGYNVETLVELLSDEGVSRWVSQGSFKDPSDV